MGGIGTIRYKVAEAARLAGVSASTLRLWETQGLVVPERSVTGHRQYTDADLARLKRISWFRSERGLNPAAIREALEAESAFTEDENGSAMPTEDNGDMQVGRKLRSLRHAAGKTLDRWPVTSASPHPCFRRWSGRRRASPSPSCTIWRNIRNPVSSLSGEEQTRARALVRAGEWRNWPRTTPGVTVQLLAEGKNQMDCHRFVLAPGASSEGAYRHEGEEFVYVLSGHVEFVLDSDQFYDLHPGDSLYFESRRRHAWSNRHDGETVLLWINTPPTF